MPFSVVDYPYTGANLPYGQSSYVNCYRMDEPKETIKHELGKVSILFPFICKVEKRLFTI